MTAFAEHPVVPIVVDLAGSLAERCQLLEDDCREAVATKIDALMATLGVPGRAAVVINCAMASTLDRPLRLTVNGEICRYPDELLLWVMSYIFREHPQAGQDLGAWLSALPPRAAGDTAAARKIVDLVALTCLELAVNHPEALLALPQAEAYAAMLAPFGARGTAGGVWPPSPAWLSMSLREVLAQRVSIGDGRLVASVLSEAGGGDDGVAIVEALIRALAADAVEVQLSADDLQPLLEDGAGVVNERFVLLRGGLFAETGVEYPPFRVSLTEDLEPGAFAFKIGCLRTIPYLALASDECLVNDTPDHVATWPAAGSSAAAGVQSRPALNPASAQPAAILRRDDFATLEPGLTTWDSREHLLLCFGEALRRYGHCFVGSSLAERRLQHAKRNYPKLASAVGGSYTAAQIGRILRRLTAERISIVNTELILDQLVEHADASRDEQRLLARVRTGLSRVIRDKLARGTDTVVVYLLDPQVEEQLAAQRWRRKTEESLCEAILSSVRAEFEQLRQQAPTALLPSILTTSQARLAVQAIVADEFPRVAVVSYEDLPTETNIMAVARIAYREA